MESNFPFLLLMLVVFVFFIILPQTRRQRREKRFMNSLKRGDRVITKSGVHAKIIDVIEKDDTCLIQTLSGKLKIERTAISLEMSSKINSSSIKKN
ncbi:MAG: preprotein translocase subunit YajC [Flavobacteriaceae bacterium TMED184]|jgi:preprotein translocase subunit YajC|nr:MAG: preprotein translocase subunit YajC [Flavobacteriaceae bacterium TMED184]|tara:strand:+ start:4799 stop:5086 length:288 start_codon:yes stop_codon:yes gene_type:complete